MNPAFLFLNAILTQLQIGSILFRIPTYSVAVTSSSRAGRGSGPPHSLILFATPDPVRVGTCVMPPRDAGADMTAISDVTDVTVVSPADVVDVAPPDDVIALDVTDAAAADVSDGSNDAPQRDTATDIPVSFDATDVVIRDVAARTDAAADGSETGTSFVVRGDGAFACSTSTAGTTRRSPIPFFLAAIAITWRRRERRKQTERKHRA